MLVDIWLRSPARMTRSGSLTDTLTADVLLRAGGRSEVLRGVVADRREGRWNPPGSWPPLYLDHDLFIVHAQLGHLFTGRGVEPDDLDRHFVSLDDPVADTAGST